MIKKLTDDILSINYCIDEIQDQGIIDADLALGKLAIIKDKLEGVGAQIDFEEEGYFSMEHDPEKEYIQLEKFHKINELYKKILYKITKLQMELLGLDGTNSIRGLFPNEEDHQDYLNGEI